MTAGAMSLGSELLHFVVVTEWTDAWRHIPGFTLCGLAWGAVPPPNVPLTPCEKCTAWLDQIARIAHPPRVTR